MTDNHLFIVGNSVYADEDKFPQIEYAQKDASEIYRVLTQAPTGIFSIKTSIHKVNITCDEFEDSLDDFLSKVTRDDFIVIYFAGHAKHLPGKNRLFLVMSNTDSNRLARTGISVGRLLDYVDEKQLIRYAIILDCCRSGVALNSSEIRHRGIEDDIDLNNFSGEGKIIITSTKEYQLAHEMESLKHGLFSYYFIEGIESGNPANESDQYLGLMNLVYYVRSQIKLNHPDIDQDPTIDGKEVSGGEIIIARNPNWIKPVNRRGSNQDLNGFAEETSKIDITNLEQCRTDILFLILGENPVNAYLSILLLIQETGKLILLHPNQSDDRNNYGLVRSLSLAISIKRPTVDVSIFELHDSDDQETYHQIDELIDTEYMSHASVGIIYSNDVVNTASILKSVLYRKAINSISSKLDLSRSALFVDNAVKNPIYIDNWPALSFEDFAILNNYEIKRLARTASFPMQILHAIVKIHQSDHGIEEWQRWVSSNRLNLSYLKQSFVLKPVFVALENLIEGELTEGRVASIFGHEKLEHCMPIFLGQWLEDFVFHTIIKLDPIFGFQDYAKQLQFNNIYSERNPFEIDVAAIWQSRLFIFPCTTATKRPQLKNRFFEASVRASQLGGNSAAITLVTCSNIPEIIESEFPNNWQQSKVSAKVFGRQHLRDLDRHFHRWFQSFKSS